MKTEGIQPGISILFIFRISLSTFKSSWYQNMNSFNRYQQFPCDLIVREDVCFPHYFIISYKLHTNTLSFIQNQLHWKPAGKKTLEQYPNTISVTPCNLGAVSHCCTLKVTTLWSKIGPNCSVYLLGRSPLNLCYIFHSSSFLSACLLTLMSQ